MESMEEIYKKHAKTVYNFLLYRTNNVEVAEELTQETFFQAIQSIDRFKGESSMNTWLCAIAKNVWRSYLQKQSKNVCMEEVDSGTTYSAEHEVFVKWEQVEIIKILHGLEDPFKELMYLRLIANLSFREIGEIMERTENWARVNYYRGREKIIKEVKKI